MLSLLAMAATAAPPVTKEEFPSYFFQKAVSSNGSIQEVMIGPVFNKGFTCDEHTEGSLETTGDALGSDCEIAGGLDPSGQVGFEKPFRTDGSTNEDWYGWNADVLAPMDAIVDFIHVNPVVNRPGELGKPPASIIVFRRSDGLMVSYAHAANFRVKVGDHVKAGQVVASVGNNGYARNPHIHIGAWKASTPYQIRWDLRAMAKIGIFQ